MSSSSSRWRTPTLLWSLAFPFLAALLVPPLAHADGTHYELHLLGTAGFQSSVANDINNAGMIAGTGRNADLSSSALVWLNGTATALTGPPGTTSSGALAINAVGDVAGQASDATTVHAAIWTAGSATILDNSASWARGLNDKGQVVGVSGLSNGRPTLWSAGSPTYLDDARNTQAYDINDVGKAVGGFIDLTDTTLHAAVWSGGQRTDLHPAGSLFSEAKGINAPGQVVGDSYWVDGFVEFNRATLWNGTSYQMLTPAGTDNNSSADDINAAGNVVGVSYTQVVDEGIAATNATLWASGIATDLNSFLDQASRDAGWHLSLATAINDSGWIVGTAANWITGLSQAYVLEPTAAVPEPTSAALVATGSIALLALRRRQRGPIAHTSCTATPTTSDRRAIRRCDRSNESRVRILLSGAQSTTALADTASSMS